MFFRFIDLFYQGGQDLQVFGFLDVKEGEGFEKESEDSLGDESKSEGVQRSGRTQYIVCGEDIRFTYFLFMVVFNLGVYLDRRRFLGVKQYYWVSFQSLGCKSNLELCFFGFFYIYCFEIVLQVGFRDIFQGYCLFVFYFFSKD